MDGMMKSRINVLKHRYDIDEEKLEIYLTFLDGLYYAEFSDPYRILSSHFDMEERCAQEICAVWQNRRKHLWEE